MEVVVLYSVGAFKVPENPKNVVTKAFQICATASFVVVRALGCDHVRRVSVLEQD
jgi:hypothetical protein